MLLWRRFRLDCDVLSDFRDDVADCVRFRGVACFLARCFVGWSIDAVMSAMGPKGFHLGHVGLQIGSGCVTILMAVPVVDEIAWRCPEDCNAGPVSHSRRSCGNCGDKICVSGRGCWIT